MECKKLLLIQMLLVGVAVAQTGQQQTFSLSDPQLQQQVRQVQPTQQVQPLRQVQQLQQVQQVRQQPPGNNDVFQRALQHHQQQQPHAQQPALVRAPQQAPSNVQTFQQENQSFQFINTRSQVPAQGLSQGFQPTPEQGRVQAFNPQSGSTEAQRSPLTRAPPPQQQQQHPVRGAPVMTFQQVPVEAVTAPLEQHDAQVFSRRPPPGSQNPAIAVAVQQPQNTQAFFRQPAPAPAPVQPPTQEIFPQQQFAQQQFQEQPLPRPQEDESSSQFQTPESQQDFQRFQQQQDFQATRTRPSGRSRGPPAVAVPIPAARCPVPAPLPQQQTVVRTTRPQTLIQVADGSAAAAAVQANDEANDELFREQAENAKYTFTSAVDDRLTDNSQVRQETRDGLNLSGLYSYSDGFYRRTVHYEADQNGYRVTKEDVEPIGDGPRPDPAGSADIATQVAGADVRYTITADDIRDNTKQQRQLQQQPLPQQQFQQGDFSSA